MAMSQLGQRIGGVALAGDVDSILMVRRQLRHYDKTYGSLGAAVGLMTWMWLSFVVILVGAELDAEMEHQTVHDTTTGPPKPLGGRGAQVADTVGKASS
jgi:membrane protein